MSVEEKMVILINHPAPTEGIHHQENNVTAYYKDKNLGKGTLYIAESVFCWIENSGEGFSLKYPSICIHAVSRDLTNFPHECLFLMVEGKFSLDPDISSSLKSLLIDGEEEVSQDKEEEEEEPDDDEEIHTVEMRFVPDNNNMLDVMFRSLSDCQVLNPDPNVSDDEEFGGGDLPDFPIYIGNVENGNSHGDYEVLEGDDYEEGEEEGEPMNEDQFEDAEE